MGDKLFSIMEDRVSRITTPIESNAMGVFSTLGSLTNAAHNVRALTAESDDPALAAAVARMVRLGDMCLVSLWAIQNQKNKQL